MNAPPLSPRFHGYVKALIVMTILLVWWGAATTTKQAGMAFADWPLSLGSVNPPGWLRHTVPFLEHSHRLFATAVGLMTLVLFAWTYVRGGKRAAEFAALFLWLGFTFALFIIAGAERQDAARKLSYLWAGSLAGMVPLAWLAWSWRKRSWPLLAKLSALALLAVTAQAILGGLRVTEISDTYAVIHGCLAQGFFCLLILIGLVSSPRWAARGDALPAGDRIPARAWTSALVLAIVAQLILGALMRHHHRSGLADTGIFLTAGQWVPVGGPEILVLMFAHKYWALAVLGLALGLAAWLGSRPGISPGLARHGRLIAALLLAQIILGVSVLLTGSPEHKRFWVTNFHVINGLAILALAFALAARCWSAPRAGLAKGGPERGGGHETGGSRLLPRTSP